MTQTTARLPTLAQVEAERCRRSLRTYIERAWHLVEPKRPFVPGWHIDAICEHLEALTRGAIEALIINIPPRHMKSLTVGVFWPTWVWTFAPAERWIYGSYIEQLATRDCVKARRIIQSPWYQDRFGDRVQLTSDQNEKRRYDNSETGYRLAMGIGGGTGEGADVGVADDPHAIDQAESETERDNVFTWWSETMSTRLARKVVVMQRVHERDLTGRLLEEGGYEHLCLPAEWEGKTTVGGRGIPNHPCVTILGPQDPRTTEGELLWPEKFDRKWIESKKRALGAYGAAGQFQQRPTARGGGQFDPDWFKIVDAAPRQAIRVRYWDKAGTQDGGKHTAGCRIAYWAGVATIEDVVRGQWGAAKREKVIKRVADDDARQFGAGAVTTFVETEPGASGKESTENTIKNLAGHTIYGDRPTGDKFVRANPLAAAAEAGNVRLLRGDWNPDFLREIEAAGPGAAHLDQMDAAAGAFTKAALGWEGMQIPGDEDQVFDEGGGFVL
jgi:predicted phage terminase large subunit-like protein